MIIGYDAKRAYLNGSGLGNYSRNTIEVMMQYFPENNYYLYTTDDDTPYFYIDENTPNVQVRTPQSTIDKLSDSFWRSYTIYNQLQKDKIDLFHGLSNELPFSLSNKKIKSIVTIHDLIFLRYPHLYSFLDRAIYNRKFKRASEISDRIIAVSEQTKEDLVHFYKIKPEKISVVYQGCNPLYYQQASEELKSFTRQKFDLPMHFILYVGTIEERKNLLGVLKSLYANKIDIPLVVVGQARKKYFDTIQEYLAEKSIHNVYFLENVELHDLRVIYQMAEVFIYASVFEGFGIPILEALNSKVPVITSKGGCFHEVGGKSTIYIDPKDIWEMGDAIKKVLSDKELREKMKIDGYEHARLFRHENIAKNLMAIYKEIIG